MGEAAVELSSVSFRYAGAAKDALSQVSLRVEEGERLGVLGPNGGGKTTLLRIMMGLTEPTVGTVRVFGKEPREARRHGWLGYVPQRNEMEHGFPLSVRQVVLMGAAWRVPGWQRVSTSVRDHAEEMIELVGAGEYAARPIGKLSGGQVQRVMIARALAASPRLLVLDEPTVGVDVAGQLQFAQLLKSVHQTLGLTMVVVSHDIRAILAGSDRVACLSRTLHSHQTPEGLTPSVIGELFSHDVAGVLGDMHVHVHRAEDCDVDGGGR